MFKLECDLIGKTPYSSSRPVQTPRESKEPYETWEARVWREHIHQDSKGEAFIPPMALKNCLSEVAKYLAETVPGKGKATYTKHFEAGVQVSDPLMLGVQAEEVPGERLFLPSDGRRGGGKRVWKFYPKFDPWRTHAVIYVVDDTITPEVAERYLREAGNFIGVGRFRPRNNGFYGRFDVENVETTEL